MSGHRLFIVDVFAERKYAGNQLAVVTGAADLAASQMQSISREMNFSETSFVLRDAEEEQGGFAVRIFTPREEVPFAGHPTLGTAFVIHREILDEPSEEVVLRLGVGPIVVAFERAPDYSELLWMHQRPPEFGPTGDGAAAGRAVGLRPEDLDPRYPVRQVSTGLPFWIVPLGGIDAVRRCRLHPSACEEFVRGGPAKAILVFATEASEPGNHIHARTFAPHYGVPEDPATGSANGCLAAYLVEHGVLGGTDVDVRVEQGWEIDRPSLLHLRAWKREGLFDVFVGGKVVPVARGELV